jgi:O-antigen/teichoic acid export membrane protein
VVALISDYLFGGATAAVSTAVLGIAFAVLWFIGPLIRRVNLPRRD